MVDSIWNIVSTVGRNIYLKSVVIDKRAKIYLIASELGSLINKWRLVNKKQEKHNKSIKCS